MFYGKASPENVMHWPNTAPDLSDRVPSAGIAVVSQLRESMRM
jgi:hypothetical protein